MKTKVNRKPISLYMNTTLKNTLYTLLYYGIVFVAFVVLNNFSPGGPCAPGGAIILLPIVPILSFVLLVKNFNHVLKSKPGYMGSALIHFAFFILAFAIALCISS